MTKAQAINELYDELYDIKKVIEKAKVANEALYSSYFGEYGENNPRIITDFEKAGYLHSIVIDYIEQSCKELDKILDC